MGPTDFALTLLNFLAPAGAVAMLLTVVSGLVWRRPGVAGSFWMRCTVNTVVGSVALAVALALFGRDGKMLAYLGLILAAASSEWWMTGRGRT